MGFLGRIGRGWLLMSQSFSSIYRQHSKLLRAAVLICAVPLLIALVIFALLGQFTGGVPIVKLFPLEPYIDKYASVLLGVGILVGVLVLVISIIVFMALYYYFAAFLQGNRVSFTAAFQAITPKIPRVLLWALFDILVGIIISYSTSKMPLLYTVLYTFWSWISLWVIPILAIENTGILDALSRSVSVAFKTLGDVVGATLWTLFVIIAPVSITTFVVARVATHVNILTHTAAGIVFALIGIYVLALLFLIFTLAMNLFNVALYVLSTGHQVTEFSPRVRAAYTEESERAYNDNE